MDYKDILYQRQSCRAYDSGRAVEKEKLDFILEAGRLSPSACNSQPYHFTVCMNEYASAVAKASQGMGLNKFAIDAPVIIVVSEESYSASAALGAKMKKNDYRSIDIGICALSMACAATEVGLSTCILGWFDDEKIRMTCHIDKPVRLLICVGYAKEADKLREKKRKSIQELITFME